MDLIWDKSTFSAEFKKHIGFVDADIPFVRLESALRSSTSEMVDLIGSGNYASVAESEEDTEFVKLVKYAILLKALIIYTPTADIAFTSRGRKLRTDDHDGTPWQWMLDANDRALNNLYYRHLDLLLKYMFKNNLAVNVDKYNHKDLMVSSLDVFEKHFNIGGSFYLYLKLLPALLECEELELMPRIGSVAVSSFDTRMKTLAEKACVFYALDWGMRRLNVELFPDGVFQTTWNTGGKTQKPSDKLQYLETAMLFKNDSLKYLQQLETEVRKLNVITDPYADRIIINSGIYGGDGFIDT